MKTILTLLLLIPTLMFGQISNWRSGNYHPGWPPGQKGGGSGAF